MTNPLIIALPLALVLLLVAYGLLRGLGQIWLNHRIRLALLEKIQDKPELVKSFQELQEVLAEIPVARRIEHHQDYTVTGILLAALGVGCTILGRCMGVGTYAVGIYVGGFICIGLGVLLALVGLLIRWLSRNPVFKG